jgi:hypothetical protein
VGRIVWGKIPDYCQRGYPLAEKAEKAWGDRNLILYLHLRH